MEKITITNPYGDSMVFDHIKTGHFILRRGDLGGVETRIQTRTGYQQRGSTVIQKDIGTKVWSPVIGVLERNAVNFKNKIAQIVRLFEPEYTSRDDLSKFTIKYENPSLGISPKYLDCFLRRTPTMDDEVKNSFGYFQRIMLSFFIPEPVWRKGTAEGINLVSIINNFEFPIEFTDSFYFGEVQTAGTTIDNGGDISSFIEIEFPGLVTNPKIENVTYGESLKLNHTIADGDKVIINTDYNNPQVKIISGGIEENAFKYIDPSNADLNMTIRRGENQITFTSDDASTTAAVLRYTEKYLSPFGGA